MWEIPQDKWPVELPLGFSLFEEEDFIHLFYENERVAIFPSTGVNPQNIADAAQLYLILKQV